MSKNPDADLVKRDPANLALQPEVVAGLVELWLASQTPATAKTYKVAVNDFARAVGRDVETAVSMLLAARGSANAMGLAYRIHMTDRKLASASVNLRLSALRSLVDHARRLDLVDWSLDVPGVASRPYRDTRGPGRAGFQRMLAAARKSPSAARDTAILWMLYGLALRRGEVAQLDLADVDLSAGVVQVKGKGDGGQPLPLTMPPALKIALGAWLAVRGEQPGPLFLNRDRARPSPTRLSTEGIADVVRICGGSTRVRPHGLRHAAITEALELTRGDLRAVQRFSRHKDVRTISRYDDNRTDLGGQVAALVSSAAALETSE